MVVCCWSVYAPSSVCWQVTKAGVHVWVFMHTCATWGLCAVWAYSSLCWTSEAQASPASSRRQRVKNNVVCNERRGARRRQQGARASHIHTHTHTQPFQTCTHNIQCCYILFFLLWLSHRLNIIINVSVHKQKETKNSSDSSLPEQTNRLKVFIFTTNYL